MGTLVLLDLMGGVALLLWGLHMVQSGILRAFGPDLRRMLGKALGNRFNAFAAGPRAHWAAPEQHGDRAADQLLRCRGLLSLVAALAIMLGANVGTTLIVQALSFNIAAIAPVLFVVGLVAFRSGPRSRIKDIGRIAIGLGLMLLSLHILLDTLAPAENAPGVRVVMASITGDPVLCIVVAALITWAVAFERCQRAIDHVAGLFAVHHALSGSGAGVRGQSRQRHQSGVRGRQARTNPASYRLPVGNLINRVVGHRPRPAVPET